MVRKRDDFWDYILDPPWGIYVQIGYGLDAHFGVPFNAYGFKWKLYWKEGCPPKSFNLCLQREVGVCPFGAGKYQLPSIISSHYRNDGSWLSNYCININFQWPSTSHYPLSNSSWWIVPCRGVSSYTFELCKCFGEPSSNDFMAQFNSVSTF